MAKLLQSIDELSLEECRKRLEAVTGYQTAVAVFGKEALELGDVAELCVHAAKVVGDNLNTPLVEILHQSRYDSSFSLNAAIGWDVPVGQDSVIDEVIGQAKFALTMTEPLIVHDLRNETRFPVPDAIRARASIMIPIGRKDSRFGVLGVHSIEPREFSDHEIWFVQSIANVLGGLITRTRQREALLEERENSRQLMHSLGQGIIVVDQDMRFELINVKFAEMLGGRRRDIINTTPFNLCLPESVPSLMKALDGTDPDSTASYEVAFRHVDGQTVYTLVSGVTRLRHGEYIGSTAVVTNISDQKATEIALRKSEERFRVLFDRAPIGMAIANLEGRYQQVNRAFCSMLGFSEDELLGLYYGEIVHPADVVNGLGEIAPFLEREIRLVRKDASFSHVLLQVALLYDEAGQPQRYVSQVVDITEKKKLEDQFRQAQKMEAIGRLAGGIAHDFNNILTAIMGYSEIIKSMVDDESESVRSAAEQIDQAAQRAARLTGQLLAFSRQQVLQPRVLDLNSLFSGIGGILHQVIGEDIEFATHLADDLAHVKADPSQIEQVIMNLVINSRDAMPRGGSLTVETQNVQITDAQAQTSPEMRAGAFVRLSVTDTGDGMDESLLAVMFDPFFTTKAMGVGTGLGLATVHGIVNQSQGFIHVESSRGEGTRFDVYLPVCDEPLVAEEPKTNPLSEGRPCSGKILLVEDEEIVSKLAQTLLQEAGYEVTTADSAAGAMRLFSAEQGHFDLLISDVILTGGVHGPDLARVLKQKNTGLQVLFTSGYNDASLGSDAAFLAKPFSSNSLLEKVSHLIKREDDPGATVPA